MTLVHVKLLFMRSNTHSFAHFLSSNKQVCADTYEQHGGHLNKADRITLEESPEAAASL